jgi:hypothetical protein
MKITYESLRSNGESPRFHPNGFIQLNLNKEGTKRLHVWSPNIALDKAQKTRHPIHDHIFDMESTIIVGAMQNLVYEFVESKRVKKYELFQARYNAPHDSTLYTTGKTGWLVRRHIDSVVAGQTYTLPAFKFHDSNPVGFTATLMTKKAIYKNKTCTVVVPYGLDPDNDFNRATALSQETMWQEIKLALDKQQNL